MRVDKLSGSGFAGLEDEQDGIYRMCNPENLEILSILIQNCDA